MVRIEEVKLEEIVRKVVKEEMETILTKFGITIRSFADRIEKPELYTALSDKESTLQKREENVLNVNKEQLAYPKYLYSMKGLREFLHCGPGTAQKLKNEGRIPYRQIGRKIIFVTEEVLNAMDPNKPYKKRKSR